MSSAGRGGKAKEGAPPPTPPAPTKGRYLDHIGFEVKDLDAFAKKLEDAGIKFDSPYRKNAAMNAAFAVFQDPFGTLIEMSEGLSAVK